MGGGNAGAGGQKGPKRCHLLFECPLILKFKKNIELSNLFYDLLIPISFHANAVGTHEESEMVASFLGGRRIMSQTPKRQTVAALELHVASKLIRHSGKIAAIFKIVNNSSIGLKNLTLLPHLW